MYRDSSSGSQNLGSLLSAGVSSSPDKVQPVRVPAVSSPAKGQPPLASEPALSQSDAGNVDKKPWSSRSGESHAATVRAQNIANCTSVCDYEDKQDEVNFSTRVPETSQIVTVDAKELDEATGRFQWPLMPTGRPHDVLSSTVGPPHMQKKQAMQHVQKWVNGGAVSFPSPRGTEEEVVTTTLATPVAAGTTVLDVASVEGFSIGDAIAIGSEFHKIKDFGSIVLEQPIAYDYPPGTTIKKVDTSTPRPQVCMPGVTTPAVPRLIMPDEPIPPEAAASAPPPSEENAERLADVILATPVTVNDALEETPSNDVQGVDDAKADSAKATSEESRPIADEPASLTNQAMTKLGASEPGNKPSFLDEAEPDLAKPAVRTLSLPDLPDIFGGGEEIEIPSSIPPAQKTLTSAWITGNANKRAQSLPPGQKSKVTFVIPKDDIREPGWRPEKGEKASIMWHLLPQVPSTKGKPTRVRTSSVGPSGRLTGRSRDPGPYLPGTTAHRLPPGPVLPGTKLAEGY